MTFAAEKKQKEMIGFSMLIANAVRMGMIGTTKKGAQIFSSWYAERVREMNGEKESEKTIFEQHRDWKKKSLAQILGMKRRG